MTKRDAEDDAPTIPPLSQADAGRTDTAPQRTSSPLTESPTSGAAASTVGLVPGSAFGPYQIECKLGQGGMGAVYKAVHSRLNKVMAIKVLSPEFTRDADAVSRFDREMRAVGALSHPNIVQAHDAGEVNGVHYLAMEFVEGTDLFEVVRQKGPMSVPNACRAIRQAALALGAAHQAGLVHRDIKPSNLLLAKNGQVKLLDLGLARLADEPQATVPLTSVGQTFGTPDYMAPEQWENVHAADGRSDLYALGCTLFFLLVGRPPFGDTHRTAANKMKGHMLDAAPDLKAARPEVPTEVAAIYSRLMAKKPNDRFQKGADLAQALQQAAAPESPADKAKPALATTKPAAPKAKSPGADLRSEAERLLKEHQYGPALRALNSLAALTDPAAKEDAAWAKAQIPKAKSGDEKMRRESTAALQLAKQLVARHDYVEAVNLLEQVPARFRSDELNTVLREASETLKEVQQLQVDIDQALARKNFVELKTAVKRFLELKPGNARMKQLWKDINTHGNSPALFATAKSRAAHSSSFASSGAGLGVAAAVILLLAGGTYWLTQSYLTSIKKGAEKPVGAPEDSTWKVVIQVDDPAASVVIDGEPVKLSGLTTEVFLKPGRHSWRASLSGKTAESGSIDVRRQEVTRLPINVRGTSTASVTDSVAVPAKLSLAELLASPDHEWTEPESIGAAINVIGPQQISSLSADERLLLFENRGRLMLSQREAVDAPFSTPTPVATTQASRGHGGSITGDGLEIVYVAVRPGGGKEELWTCSRPTREASFGEPTPLPEPINSAQGERHPIFSADGLTLVYTSTRNGNGDIWMARRTARDQPFGAPSRLEAPVSTGDWDIACWVSDDGLVVCTRRQIDQQSNSLVWTRPSRDAAFVAAPPLAPWPNTVAADMWLAPDGRRLYVTKKNPTGGPADFDIYVSHLVPKQGAAAPATEPTEPSDTVEPTGRFALQFDGVDDYVDVPSLNYDGSHPLTVEAWILGEGEGTAWLIGGNPVFRLALTGDEWRLLRVEADGNATAASVQRGPTRRFLHLCLTVDGEDWRLSLNGRRSGTLGGRGRFPVMSKATSSFGGNPRTVKAINGGYLACQILSLRVSKTVRYQGNFRPPARLENDADTLALYLLEEGLGDTVKDVSGHGHDGKIIGATWVQPTANRIRRTQQ